MNTFQLRIVTPDGEAYSGQAEALRVYTTAGYVSIRAHHADYMAALEIGEVTVTQDGKARHAACGGGFLSVEHGEARLVATSFEYADEIDIPRAELAREKAQKRLLEAKEHNEENEIRLATAKLARAQNRLKIADR